MKRLKNHMALKLILLFCGLAIAGGLIYWVLLEKQPLSSAESSEAAEQVDTVVKETANDEFKVVAYYPSWSSDYGFSRLRLDVITHVNYAFAYPTVDGDLEPLANPELAREIVRLAHAEDRKVLLSVGGWCNEDNVLFEGIFVQGTSTPEKVASMGEAILAMCDEYGFDGIDMDWEYPRLDDGSYRQYEDLISYLSERLHANGKLLTAAVMDGIGPDGTVYADAAAQTDRVLDQVDWINIMAYDGGDGLQHSGYEYAVRSAEYWKNTRQLDPAKIVLGVPFYGRPNFVVYEELLASSDEAYQSDQVIYNGTEIWYNGQDTIARKTNYALENLNGIMIWEITQDTADTSKSLLSAIQETLEESEGN